MAGLHEEAFLELPLEQIKSSCGFGLDIGGSIAKLVYRSKKDFKDGESITEYPRQGYGQIRLKGFPREKLDDVLDFICDNCDLTREDDGMVHVHTTGIGGNQFQRKIEEKLNSKLKNETEFDLFVRAFYKLGSSLGKKSIILPESKEGKKEGLKVAGQFMRLQAGLAKHSGGGFESKALGDAKEDEVLFPCLLVMCGSGAAVMKVNEDGTFEIVDGLMGGGRTFLGLSNFLTGVKNFDELMEMASRADGGTTDVFAKHLKSKDSDDVYSSFADDHVVYTFGQGTEKSRDDVKKEDLVFSLLTYIAYDMVHTAHLNATIFGMRRVYFCGNFVNHEMTRQKLTARYTLRNVLSVREHCEYGFIKHGGFLGAIGAYFAGSKSKQSEKADNKVAKES